jgi:hypothetical protein
MVKIDLLVATQLALLGEQFFGGLQRCSLNVDDSIDKVQLCTHKRVVIGHAVMIRRATWHPVSK